MTGRWVVVQKGGAVIEYYGINPPVLDQEGYWSSGDGPMGYLSIVADEGSDSSMTSVARYKLLTGIDVKPGELKELEVSVKEE